MRLAVVGAGWAGDRQARAIADHPTAELAAVIDPDLLRARKIAESYGDSRTVVAVDLAEIGTVDAVVLCTPTALHFDQTMSLIARGIPVLVEKPFTQSLDQARTVAAASAEAGVPVGVMVAPVVPAITDHELEAILAAAREAGAGTAGYVLLRLPHELKTVWREWLVLHYPDRADHVMSLLQQMHGGRDYDPRFGRRMRGEGPFADLLAARFARARRRLGFGRLPPLRTGLFMPPRTGEAGPVQGALF